MWRESTEFLLKKIKKKKNDDIKTYSFETIFTNKDGYTFKLIAPKVRFKKYSITEECDSEYTIYGRYNFPIIHYITETNIELLLKSPSRS